MSRLKNLIKRFANSINLKRHSLPNSSYVGKHELSGLALDFVLNKFEFSSVLDVGSGSGRHASEFEANGKIVTRFDFGKSRAFTDKSDVIIGDFAEYKFEKKFELVWASHVLEHSLDSHRFLIKLLEVVESGGVVAITVPPAKSEFVGGHVSLWTPALLLYRMVLAGFDCSNANVLVYGYNISVILKAKKNSLALDVTSRQVVRLFLEQLWFEFVPFLHRLQGRLAAQG